MLCSWQESWDWVWVALASEILHIQYNGWPSAVLLPPQHHKQGWCPGLAAQLRVGDPCVALRWLGCSRKGVNVGSGVLGAGAAATNKE